MELRIYAMHNYSHVLWGPGVWRVVFRPSRRAQNYCFTAMRPVSMGTSSNRAPVLAMNSSTALRAPSQ